MHELSEDIDLASYRNFTQLKADANAFGEALDQRFDAAASILTVPCM
jgi:hypothetical protein